MPRLTAGRCSSIKLAGAPGVSLSPSLMAMLEALTFAGAGPQCTHSGSPPPKIGRSVPATAPNRAHCPNSGPPHPRPLCLQARLKFRDLVSLKALPYPSLKIQKRLRWPDTTWGVRLRSVLGWLVWRGLSLTPAGLVFALRWLEAVLVAVPAASHSGSCSDTHPHCSVPVLRPARCSYECPLESLATFYRPPARLMMSIDNMHSNGVQLTQVGARAGRCRGATEPDARALCSCRTRASHSALHALMPHARYVWIFGCAPCGSTPQGVPERKSGWECGLHTWGSDSRAGSQSRARLPLHSPPPCRRLAWNSTLPSCLGSGGRQSCARAAWSPCEWPQPRHALPAPQASCGLVTCMLAPKSAAASRVRPSWASMVAVLPCRVPARLTAALCRLSCRPRELPIIEGQSLAGLELRRLGLKTQW